MSEAEKIVDKFTKWTYMKTELTYAVDELTGEKRENPVDVKWSKKAENAADSQWDTLKAAMQDFLKSEKYDASKDGQLFYAQQDEQVYVGFARVDAEKKAHEHLALFFRLEIEVTTAVTTVNASLEEVKEAFA